MKGNVIGLTISHRKTMYSYATKRKALSPADGQKTALSRRAEDSALAGYLSGLSGSKLSMSGELQQKIRERCGISPEGIRVYRDRGLANLGQKAYARGSEIHVAENAGSLDSEAGHRLILHEAAHIVQQGKSHSIAAGINETPALESEAHAVADGAHMDASGFTAPMPAQAAPIQGFSGWEKAKKFLAKGGHAIADKAVGAYDWVRNKLDDYAEHKKQKKEAKGPGFFSRLGSKISDAYQGSKLQSAVKTAGRGLKAAGGGIASAAKKLGGGVASVAKTVGGGIASAAKAVGGGIASGARSIGNFIKAHRNPNKKPGIFSRLGTKISNAYQGSKLQSMVNGAGRGLKKAGAWTAGKAKKIGSWTVDKGKKLYNWGMDKKQSITDWIEEKKDALAEHEKNRYMTNKANREKREGSKIDYNTRIEAARLALGNGDIGERMRNRANLTDVLEYQSPRSEAGLMDKVKGKLANKQDLVSMGLKGGLSGTEKLVTNLAPESAGDIVEGAFSAAKGVANLAMHGYQKSNVNNVSDDKISEGATDEQARMLRLARGNMSDKLSRDMVEDGTDIASGALDAVGSGLNAVLPGASTVTTLLNKGVSLGSTIAQNSMTSSGNWRSIKDEIFGSQDNYRAFKKAHGLRKKDMQLLLAEQTGFRDVDEMADSSKWQQAQTIDTLLGKDGDNGAKALMAAKGVKGAALKIRDVEDIAENDIGTSMTLKTLEHNRDRRLKKKALAGAP